MSPLAFVLLLLSCSVAWGLMPAVNQRLKDIQHALNAEVDVMAAAIDDDDDDEEEDFHGHDVHAAGRRGGAYFLPHRYSPSQGVNTAAN